MTRWRKTAVGRRLTRLAVRALIGLIAIVGLCACDPGTITRSGDKTHHLFEAYLIVSIVVLVIVGGAIIVLPIVFRERRGRPATDPPPQIHGHLPTEIIWTVIPALVLFTLLGFSLNDYEQINANADPALTIDVTAYQWQWSFTYANGEGKSLGVTQQAQSQFHGPVLYLPVGEEIRFVLHSADVIHSFFVPAFFFKRDVIPGYTNVFTQELDASSAGHTYPGACAQFCGLWHSQMRFTVAPLTQSAFGTWLTSQEKKQAQPVSCVSHGPKLSISAKNIHFSTACLAAPADTPLTLTFKNEDSGVPHDVAIYTNSSATKVLFRGQIITGPSTVVYHIPALPAGTYYFRCDVHPTAMHGTFIVVK